MTINCVIRLLIAWTSQMKLTVVGIIIYRYMIFRFRYEVISFSQRLILKVFFIISLRSLRVRAFSAHVFREL